MAGRRPTPVEALIIASAAAAILLFPLLAGKALESGQPRRVAGAALAIVVASLLWRGALERRSFKGLAPAYAPSITIIVLSLATNRVMPLLLLPALVNLQLAFGFGRTLRNGPCMVERAAAFLQPHLPDFTRPYCRKVTALWTLFFAVNTGIIAWLALRAPDRWWLVYTSRIYFGVVLVFSIVEFLVRKILFRHYGGGPIDRVFMRLFPAHNTERGRRSQAYLDEMRRLGLKTD